MPDNESSPRREERVDEAIAAYLQAIERGETLDREQFLAAHPDIAEELRAFFGDRSHPGNILFNLARLGLPVFLLWLFAGPFAATSHAVSIPISFGHGEKVTELGKLPPEVHQVVAQQLGANVSVGFLFDRFHIHYVDLWTWNGRHVLYDVYRYLALDAEQWQQYIGESIGQLREQQAHTALTDEPPPEPGKESI